VKTSDNNIFRYKDTHSVQKKNYKQDTHKSWQTEQLPNHTPILCVPRALVPTRRENSLAMNSLSTLLSHGTAAYLNELPCARPEMRSCTPELSSYLYTARTAPASLRRHLPQIAQERKERGKDDVALAQQRLTQSNPTTAPNRRSTGTSPPQLAGEHVAPTSELAAPALQPNRGSRNQS
jgi:hypothetical protein